LDREGRGPKPIISKSGARDPGERKKRAQRERVDWLEKKNGRVVRELKTVTVEKSSRRKRSKATKKGSGRNERENTWLLKKFVGKEKKNCVECEK